MGLLFKSKRKHVNVTVQGLKATEDAADGRYDRQKKLSDRKLRKKMEVTAACPHTPEELMKHIEETYRIKELEQADERYQAACQGVKAHLVFRYAPELLTTPERPAPDHAPTSEHDPDYAVFKANEEKRFQEAAALDRKAFPLDLHVYSISLMQGETPVAWIEVFIETVHQYLAFEKIPLEYEEHYLIDRTLKDIVGFFGFTEEDRKEDNDRYLQYMNLCG